MRPITRTHTTDGDGTWDAVTTDVACRKVIIRPKSSDVTGGYQVSDSSTGATPFDLDESESWTFDAGEGNLFPSGAIVGYTKTTNAGPFTFNKKHE